MSSSDGKQTCGISSGNEMRLRVTGCTATLSGDGERPLVVRVWTNLDTGAHEESFGIDNVVVKKIYPGIAKYAYLDESKT